MVKKVFVNFSNHPSNSWDEKQKKASEQYGSIEDLSFPMVSAQASREEVSMLAQDYYRKIMEHHPVAVMCQGEFTLCFRVVELLKQARILVLAVVNSWLQKRMERKSLNLNLGNIVNIKEYENLYKENQTCTKAQTMK